MFLIALAIGWLVIGVAVLALGTRDVRARGSASRVTAALLWPWHALNYALVVTAATEGLWTLGVPPRLGAVAGTLLVGAGVAALIAGFYEFRSEERLTGMRNDELITGGIYRYSRHPQYLGIALTLLGIAVIGRSGLALAIAASLVVVFAVYLPFEERFLERTFGARYRRYRERTPMLVGPPRAPR